MAAHADHFYGLVQIIQPGGASLGEVLNLFKGSVTREARRSSAVHAVIARHGGKEPAKVWTPNYYDVICFDAKKPDIKPKLSANTASRPTIEWNNYPKSGNGDLAMMRQVAYSKGYESIRAGDLY